MTPPTEDVRQDQQYNDLLAAVIKAAANLEADKSEAVVAERQKHLDHTTEDLTLYINVRIASNARQAP